MPRHEFSKEDLEQLTEEELEGLEDDDLVDEGEEVDDDAGDDDTKAEEKADDGKKDAAADDKTEEEDKGEDDKSDDKSAEKPEAKKAAEKADEPVKPEEPAEEVEAKPAPKRSAIPTYDVPADAKDKLADIDKRLDELAQKFDDGELTATEYRQQMKPIEQEKDTLREKMLKASLSNDFTVATWKNDTVPAFLSEHEEYGKSKALWTALDQRVRELQTEADNPFDPTLLTRAHADVQADLRKAMGVPEPKKEDTPKPKTAGKPREAPPTLGGVPASDITDEGDGGEYAYLDRLAEKDPLAFEDALAKLSDAKRDEYLAQ